MANKAASIYAEAFKRSEKEKQNASRSPIGKPRKPRKPTPKDEPMQPRKTASVHTPTGARTRISIYTRIRKAVVKRSRLGGFTFRYQSEELDRLDAVVAQVNENREVKVSKNDVVRIALNWLLEDYDESKNKSVLSKVVARLRR